MLLKGLLFTAFGFLALSTLGESDYYTWVDENGVTNYAEQKPADTDARLVTHAQRFGYPARDESRAQVDKTTAAGSASTGTPAEVDPDKLIADEKARVEATLSEQRKFNCNVGKKNLVRLETHARIKITDDSGSTRFMSSEEMDAKKTESRTLIQENCTG